MSAVDEARKVLKDRIANTLDSLPPSYRREVDRIDLDMGIVVPMKALRAIVDDRDALMRELHHFEVEQAIEHVLNLTGSLAPEPRRILTEAIAGTTAPAVDEQFTVRGLMRALATYPADAELGTSDPFIDVGVYVDDGNGGVDWHTVIAWGEGVKSRTPMEEEPDDHA